MVTSNEETNMLKYQNLANTGDIIRAYDFRGNREAYIQGKVIAKGAVRNEEGAYMLFDGYTIEITEDGADFGRKGDIGYIPFETSMDYDERVELIVTCEMMEAYFGEAA